MKWFPFYVASFRLIDQPISLPLSSLCFLQCSWYVRLGLEVPHAEKVPLNLGSPYKVRVRPKEKENREQAAVDFMGKAKVFLKQVPPRIASVVSDSIMR